jgi:murein DD-endopeptidase MepM/ murein hydrolase activator NlpD
LHPARRAASESSRRRITLPGSVAALALLLAAGQSHLAVAGGGGGIDPPEAPELSGVSCLEACAGERKAAVGSRVELRGANLGGVTAVKFSAAGESRISVAPLSAEPRRVTAQVPDGAVTGRPKVADDLGNADTSPETLTIVSADQIPEAGEFQLRRADARPGKVYFAGARDAKVAYVFDGAATDVRIRVVKRGSDEVVADFTQDAREPFVEHVAAWDGRDEAGKLVEKGKLKFRIGPVSSGSSESTPDARFDLYSHKFPLRGRHTYGDGFGAGRGHQGQDVFAACGTRIEAARAGEVQVKGFQSAAGNYVVIDGRSDNHDYVYMHLKRPASVREGENVKTGEAIGKEGDTGNATGCHLHFEYWRNDWFNGGRALSSVTRKLRLWDGWS